MSHRLQMVKEKLQFRKTPVNYAVQKTELMKIKVSTLVSLHENVSTFKLSCQFCVEVTKNYLQILFKFEKINHF